VDRESTLDGDGCQRTLASAGAIFKDRADAGCRLAALLERFRCTRPVVVGIPRGGIPVAAEVARILDAPLEVGVVRKVGAPRNPEYAVGALAEGGVLVLDRESLQAIGLTDAQLRALIAGVAHEVSEQTLRYRGNREPMSLTGRTAILVDDGLATGRSAQAAVQSLRKRDAARVILAVPVAAAESVDALRSQVDEIVCVEMPKHLWAVGYWYEDFRPTTDEEVVTLLSRR
jgi:putative phosphoribosyl transferase